MATGLGIAFIERERNLLNALLFLDLMKRQEVTPTLLAIYAHKIRGHSL